MSNTNRLHFKFIKERFPIINKFDKLILSYNMKIRKPHPRIYKHALKLANTTPKRTIYIDDRPELIEGARKLGINGIIFKNLKQLKKDLKKFLVCC